MTQFQIRKNYIIDELEKNGKISVKEISERFSCSEVTARADIQNLADEGLLKRVRGGAVSSKQKVEIRFSLGDLELHKEQKKRIARKAYEDFIQDKDTIIIDDSTTGNYLAEVIRSHPEKRLTVVTNSLVTALILSGAAHVDLFVTSGHVIAEPPSALDNLTVDAFRQFHVAKAFIGSNKINYEKGLFAMGAPQRDTKRSIISVSDEVYVIADHTKFGSGNLFNICGWDKIDAVITDSDVDEETLAGLKKTGVRFELA